MILLYKVSFCSCWFKKWKDTIKIAIALIDPKSLFVFFELNHFLSLIFRILKNIINKRISLAIHSQIPRPHFLNINISFHLSLNLIQFPIIITNAQANLILWIRQISPETFSHPSLFLPVKLDQSFRKLPHHFLFCFVGIFVLKCVYKSFIYTFLGVTSWHFIKFYYSCVFFLSVYVGFSVEVVEPFFIRACVFVSDWLPVGLILKIGWMSFHDEIFVEIFNIVRYNVYFCFFLTDSIDYMIVFRSEKIIITDSLMKSLPSRWLLTWYFWN